MPNYLFKSQEGEIKEIFQHMNDNHVYEEDGVAWERIFTVPNAAVDIALGDGSDKDSFMRQTNKKMTVGDMWDISQEMSDKRVKSEGVDVIKEKTVKKYEKKTHGKEHPNKHGNVAKKEHFSI